MKQALLIAILLAPRLLLGQGVSSVPQFQFFADTTLKNPLSGTERYLMKSADFRFYVATKFGRDKLPSLSLERLCVKGESYIKFDVSNHNITGIAYSKNMPVAIADLFMYAIKESEYYWKTDKKIHVLYPVHYALHNSCKSRDDIVQIPSVDTDKIIFSDKSKKSKKYFDIIFEPHPYTNVFETFDLPITKN